VILLKEIKIKDAYFAGTVIGVIGGILHNLLLLLLLLMGLKTRTFWKDMAELLFKPPEVLTWHAQFLGLMASLAIAGILGVLIPILINFTGRDYIYTKAVSLSSGMGFFVFLVVYPARGLVFLQHSIITNYVAFFTFIFYGLVVGYMMKHFTEFGGKT
jgi:ABC-type multidrug transport system fused ATPase/permease subunit